MKTLNPQLLHILLLRRMWLWIVTLLSIISSTFRALNLGYQMQAYAVTFMCQLVFTWDFLQKDAAGRSSHLYLLQFFYLVTALTGVYQHAKKKKECNSVEMSTDTTPKTNEGVKVRYFEVYCLCHDKGFLVHEDYVENNLDKLWEFCRERDICKIETTSDVTVTYADADKKVILNIEGLSTNSHWMRYGGTWKKHFFVHRLYDENGIRRKVIYEKHGARAT